MEYFEWSKTVLNTHSLIDCLVVLETANVGSWRYIIELLRKGDGVGVRQESDQPSSGDLGARNVSKLFFIRVKERLYRIEREVASRVKKSCHFEGFQISDMMDLEEETWKDASVCSRTMSVEKDF